PKLLQAHTSVAVGKWHLGDYEFDQQHVQHPIEMGFDSFAGSLYNLDTAYNDWTKTVYPEDLTFLNYFVYATGDTAADALQRIGSLPEPWFTYVAFNAAHEPLHCPLSQGFPPDGAPAGACATDWCNQCEALLSTPPFNAMFPDVVESRALGHSVDAEIGRLLAAIDPAKTVVVLVADNGSGLRT